MKILLKQFEALATDWKNLNEFKKARINLTGQYILILFLILNIFTISIWGLLNYKEDKFRENIQIQWEKKEVVFSDQNMTIIQVQQIPKPKISQTEVLDLQHLFLEDLKENLLWIETLLLIFAGFCSYWLAGQNLQVIKNKMLTERQFLSDVSHELKNPLAALQTTLEISRKQKKWKKDELIEVFSDLLQEIKRLSTLTNDLLFLEKKSIKSREILDLSEIINNVQKTLENFAKEKGVSFNLSIENQQKIYGNQDDLTKMFFNLLHNAVKFSNPHEKVKVFIKNNEIFIENKGKVISKKFNDKLFQRFTKEEVSRDFHDGGSGLGLAIAKKIADEHKAKISFTSEKGKTVFKILL